MECYQCESNKPISKMKKIQLKDIGFVHVCKPCSRGFKRIEVSPDQFHEMKELGYLEFVETVTGRDGEKLDIYDVSELGKAYAENKKSVKH